MNPILLVATLTLAQFTVEVSPERAEPFSYSDEPLAIRIHGAPTGVHRLSAIVADDAGVESVVDLGVFEVMDGKPVYAAIAEENLRSGPNIISITIDEATVSEFATVYRVNRPSDTSLLPIEFVAEDASSETLNHAVSLPASVLHVDSSFSNYEPLLAELDASLAVNIDPMETMTSGELVDRFPESRSWTVPIDVDPQSALAFTALLRELVPRPKIVLAPVSVEALTAYLADDSRAVPDVLIVPDGEEAFSYRVPMEQAGSEFVVYRSAAESLLNVDAPLIAPRLVTASTEDDPSRRAYLNVWSTSLLEYDVVGEYFTTDPIKATLFRHRGESGAWMLAVSAELESPWEIPEDLDVTSVYSASLNVYPDVPDSLVIDNAPIFLRGDDPQPLTDSLTRQIQLELKTLTAVDSYMDAISGELKNELNVLLEQSPIVNSRSAFLAILRALPDLETMLIQEQVAPHVVIPLVARLGRIARLMAALAEVTAQPFLEPSATMLTQSNRFVARYMSRNPGVDRDSRPGQLVRHISSLTEEASRLESSGLRIEAAGVAMLTLWRSRALTTHGDDSP